MSSSHDGESANAMTDNGDWRKPVDEVQKFLASKASILLVSLKPGNNQSVKAAIEQGPVVFAKIQELEKLQQKRLDDIELCHTHWQDTLSERTLELTDLTQKVTQQQNHLSVLKRRTEQTQAEASKVRGKLSSLAHQRMDALEKLKTLEEASKRHEDIVREEDIRLNDRSTGLDARQQGLDLQEATLVTAHEALQQEQHDLADRQAEEARREEDNKKKAAKISKRLDILTDYQAYKDKQVTDLITQYGGLADAKKKMEEQVAKVNDSIVHLTGVLLPQKEAELTSLKANVAKMHKDTSALDKELRSRISKLEAEKASLEAEQLSLQERYQGQCTQLSDLDHAHTSLRAVADENSTEAKLAKAKLDVAEATIKTLNSEIDRLRERDVEFQAEVDILRRCKIDFDAAARIQTASNDRIRHLEQECGLISRERNNSRQQLDTLEDNYRRLCEEANRSTELHDQALEQQNRFREQALEWEARNHEMASDQMRRQCEVAENERNELIEENITLRAQRDELKGNVNALGVECDQLHTANADLQHGNREMSQVLADTKAEVDRLRQQLHLGHGSSRRSSRKHRHEEVDSDEEESASAHDSDRLARRSGKAPKSRSNLFAVGRSGSDEGIRDSLSPELPGPVLEDTSPPAGPSTSGAGQLMNTAAPRALGTANPTVTPSDGVAFAISVQDATLLNFSSDVLPLDIVQTLGRKFRLWAANPTFTWVNVQSFEKRSSCIEARLERKKSEWSDGYQYACARCERMMRLCVVVSTREQVLLLPRKAAEDAGQGPTEVTYWMR